MSERETAIVVGVGPGLGMALVRTFADAGMNVVMAARNAGNLEEMRPGDYGDAVVSQACDATDVDSVAALFSFAAETFAAPDVVVFNAGAYAPGKVLEISPEDFERCWRVGCFAGLLVGQQAARAMLERGHGTIIMTGATAAMRGGAGFANLASPKFGLRALSQSMARELGPENIHVAHVIIDGQIDSERYRDLKGERGPDALLNPDDIAAVYLQLHRQPRSAWTQEQDLRPWSEKF